MTVTIELPPPLQAQAEELAAARGESVEALLQEAIEVYLNTAPAISLNQRQARNQERLRVYCAERGLEWDGMSEQERESIISQLVHESRDGTSHGP